MKILFFSDNFPPERNAAATRVFERAAYWVKWGHQVTVITSAPNFPEGKIYAGYSNRWYFVENIEGVRVVRVKTLIFTNRGSVLRIFDFLSFMVSSFISAFFQSKPDVIVATSPQFFTAVAGGFHAALRRVPFVFELSDLWPASITAVGAMKPSFILSWVERMELFLYRRSAIVIALTSAFKVDLVRRKIPEGKVKVVINGVDLPRYSPRARDQKLAKRWGLEDHFVVGYLGTHGMAHALENVLEAAVKLKDEPGLVILFVGAGAARDSLKAKSEKLGLGNVVFIPSQSKKVMPDYWSLCDIALIHLKNSPVFEGVIPSKIFEAMGMGLPLLYAGPRGEASQIILKEDVGVVVPAEDPKALAEAILRLKGDSIHRKKLSNNSVLAAPRYSREKQAFDMIQAMETIL